MLVSRSKNAMVMPPGGMKGDEKQTTSIVHEVSAFPSPPSTLRSSSHTARVYRKNSSLLLSLAGSPHSVTVTVTTSLSPAVRCAASWECEWLVHDCTLFHAHSISSALTHPLFLLSLYSSNLSLHSTPLTRPTFLSVANGTWTTRVPVGVSTCCPPESRRVMASGFCARSTPTPQP